MATLLAAFLIVATEVVDWRDAASCVGQVCSLRGTVAVSEEDGPTIRLYFDAHDRTVRVLLMRGWLVTWPHYDRQTIVATGRVGRFRNHIEMIVVDPRSVIVEAGAPEPTATPAATLAAPPPAAAPPAATRPPEPQAATATATAAETPPSELERLRERVRELEERVRELEE